MRTILIVCLALAAGAMANPTPRTILTDTIKIILEANRNRLANLTIDSIPITTKGEVTNLTLVNLETIELEMTAPGNPLSSHIDTLNAAVAWASGSGTYTITNGELPNLGLILNGAGAASGHAETINFLVTDLQVRLDGTTPQIEEMGTVTAAASKVQLSLEGIPEADTAAISADLPRWLAEDLPALVEANKAAIMETVNAILREVAP